ncbi:MAG: glutamate-1-semialdehyde 2,1-aminomutase [Deltaproteobacteria bacterium]|nr:glutamate-1-semialdehyde 2,1-aminomutase [Deltaproteobacteria bacterium]
METSRSTHLLSRARKKIPGGVNSPVRAWKAVSGQPRFIARGVGARVFDVDGNEYTDFLGSWGPLILGHAHPEVVQAVTETLTRGTTFGAPTEGEVELAELVSQRMPSIEQLRLVSSGTEAAMSAVRLARGFTGRPKVIKFDGCYHGHSDGLLARAGSGVATLALPDSPGVPPAFAGETLVVPFNDLNRTAELFRKYPGVIAAVIVEPICGNMGVMLPAPQFLAGLRELTRQDGALLIFDEVITGFRVAAGGAQEVYGVAPDLTCLGKILGGGLPLGAFGGKKEIMALLAPEGPVYQAGTLSGNPLAVAAGLATLRRLARPGVYQRLEEHGQIFEDGLEKVLDQYGMPGLVNRAGSMLTLFFGVETVNHAGEARLSDQARFGRYFHGMLERGIYLPPSQFEAVFISLAHERKDLENALNAFELWVRLEATG